MSSAAEVLPETVDAATAWRLDGVFPDWAQVRLQGTMVLLTYAVDEAEVARRRGHGRAAITSPDVLALLLRLPAGIPVSLAGLDAADRRAVRRLPAGLVAMEGGRVVRLAVPPLRAGLVVVAARGWRHGLATAGRFAPFCARAMVLRGVPRDVESARMEAGFYGIGVISTVGEGQPRMLVPPAPFEQRRFTAAGWLFLEEAFAQVERSRVTGAAR